MQALLAVHIVAGGLAVITGGLALIASKGSWLHRRSGLVFVYAMVTMGTSASILAVRTWNVGNLMAGLITAYFVVTALTTVRPVTAWSQRVTAGAMSVALSVGSIDVYYALRMFGAGRLFVKGVPVPMIMFLGTVLLLGAFGDYRVLRTGPPRGAPRLKRHLWRMCFALFIAAGSFFSIRARVARILPEPFLSGPMRALPVLLVFVAMFYWLWRLRTRSPTRIVPA